MLAQSRRTPKTRPEEAARGPESVPILSQRQIRKRNFRLTYTDSGGYIEDGLFPMCAMATIRPDDDKFRELILYASLRCQEDPYFGKTKLNKILFYADFTAYAELGQPITGQDYMRLAHGPGPRRMKPLLDSMLVREEVEIRQEARGELQQERVIPKRPPKVEVFTAQELAIVNRVIRALWGRTNSRVSEISHANIGWRLAGDKETIPYETVFLSDRPLTEEEIEYGRQLAAELGL